MQNLKNQFRRGPESEQIRICVHVLEHHINKMDHGPERSKLIQAVQNLKRLAKEASDRNPAARRRCRHCGHR